MREGRSGTPRGRGWPRADGGPPRRSTGSGTVSCARSSGRLEHALTAERHLVGAGDPRGEALTGQPLLEVGRDDVRHVVVEPRAGHLVGAQLAAELPGQADAATEVHLETLDLLAVVVQDELALEPDVGHLRARTRVRAAVDVDRDGRVQGGEPPFELLDE